MFAGDWGACKIQVESVYAAMDRSSPSAWWSPSAATPTGRQLSKGPIGRDSSRARHRLKAFHYVEWVAEALRTGKLKIDPAKRIKEPVTYQDSCNYVRNAGLGDCAREIMSYIAEDFGRCGPAGSTTSAAAAAAASTASAVYRQERNIGLKVKRDQILATGAKLVVAPCHNCWDAIRDLEEVYKIGIRWSFLKPMLLNMVEVPEHLQAPG
jgi:Fe-S oxidoreductase